MSDKHLQDPFIINLIEDSAIDLIGFQSHPVEHWHPELGLDWLLNLHSWEKKKAPLPLRQISLTVGV